MFNSSMKFKLAGLAVVTFTTAGFAQNHAAVTGAEIGVATGYVAAATTTTTQPAASTGAVSPAPTASTFDSTAATVSAPSDSKVFGLVDIRPSYYPNNDAGNAASDAKVVTENTVELGYQSDKNTKFIGDLYINTGRRAGSNEDFAGRVYIDQMDVKATFNEIWKNDSGLSFSYEPRLRLGLNSKYRDSGKLTEVRNYLKLKQAYSNGLNLTLSETPIYHLYDQSRKADGSPNSIFENRVYLQLDGKITKNLSFFVVGWYAAVKPRSLAGLDASSSNWSHALFVWPEIDYALTDNYSIGLAYQSAAFKLNDFATEDTFGAQAKNGEIQLVFTAAF